MSDAGGTGRARSSSMDLKRYFRGPVFWIAVVLLVVFLGSRLVTSTGGFEKVDTQTVVDEIRAGNVESARVIDREQRVELTLKNGDKIRASYLSGTGDDIVSDLQETRRQRSTTSTCRRRTGSSACC